MQASSKPLRRIYMDNAATTWPKCQAGVQAACDYVEHCGATAGRGAYRSALNAENLLLEARVNVADLIGAQNSKTIAFCNSGTHALNCLLHGLLDRESIVLTTEMEHNSVLRPLVQLFGGTDENLCFAPADASGRADLTATEGMVTEKTQALVLGHASNVTGAVNDLGTWSQFARRNGLTFLVDVSQTLGYVPINCDASGIGGLAAAGHKGLRGLVGTGLLMLGVDYWPNLIPLMQGGTGTASENVRANPTWPHSVEVGNLNLPGIASMSAAAGQLARLEDLAAGWRPTFEHLVRGLLEIESVNVVGDYDFSKEHNFVPVVSIKVDDWDIGDLGNILDGEYGIEARTGWHCAALVHDHLGSVESGGTLRFSTSRSTSIDEVDFVLASLREILG
ncbi:MAG: aminotransferase class V-fold PLP-dependent enzyme [Planctomycetota bacterium]